jgi:hypothetical protein
VNAVELNWLELDYTWLIFLGHVPVFALFLGCVGFHLPFFARMWYVVIGHPGFSFSFLFIIGLATDF